MHRHPLALLLLFLALPASADPPFTNVATERGISGAYAGRCQLIDVNGDGWLDLCVDGKGPGAYRVYYSVAGPGGRRVFVERTTSTGLHLRPDGRGGRLNSFVVWGDVDGDGRIDAVSVASQTAEQYAKDPQTHVVYRGTGRGRYAPVADPGLARSAYRNTMAAVLMDLDRDGKLDLAFGNQYVAYGKSLDGQQMRAYLGKGEGRFADVTEAWGLLTPGKPGEANAARPLYGLTATDLDNDGYPELLGAAYGRRWNTVWKRTAEAAKYTEIGEKLGVAGDTIRHGKYPAFMQGWWTKKFGKPRATEQPFRANGNTFALVPCDFDGDGDIDLFSAEITHAWAGDSSDLSALLVNGLVGGKLGFARQIKYLDKPDPPTGFSARATRGLHRDITPQTLERWNQGDLQAHWADLDCDGLVDLIVCESDYPHNKLRVWLQKADHTFVESQAKLGLNWNCCPGAALGDFDRDGDIDLVTTGTRNRWKDARAFNQLGLWKNDARGENGFLCVLLVGDGKTANTSAIGARVTLVTDAGTQRRELSGPYGHWSAQTQPGELHFGLGKATPRQLVVTWPDGKRSTTTIETPRPNSWIVVRQGQAPVTLESFDPEKWRAYVEPPKPPKKQ